MVGFVWHVYLFIVFGVKVKAILESDYGRRCRDRLTSLYANREEVKPSVEEATELQDYLVSYLIVVFAARYNT